MAEILRLEHLEKSFGTHAVLRGVDLRVEKGEVLSVIGASGSGKSTMLRCINLLETPTAGQVRYRGQTVTERTVNLPQYRAKVGMVFQSFNLFHNMTALENCIVGQTSVLGRKRPEAREISTRSLRSSRAGRSSAWPLRVRWPWSRRCCCLTSRPARSTRRWSVRCFRSCVSWRRRG